jgi:ion channel
MADFAQTSVVAAFDKAFKEHDALLNKHLELSDKILRLRVKRRDLLESWERERLQRLGFFDFLYFSMGVATSNTFGDLIPNDRMIRTVIVTQLVLSILLVGLLIEAITKR